MSLRYKRNLCALVVGLILGAWAHFSFALPAGSVVSFNLAACPTGWTALSGAAGRVVVGVGTLGSDSYALSATGGEASHTLTTAEVPSHYHLISGVDLYYFTGGFGSGPYQGYTSGSGYSGVGAGVPGTDSSGGGGAHENRPPYLALLYCSLDADETADSGSTGAQAVIVGGVLTLFALGFLAGVKP